MSYVIFGMVVWLILLSAWSVSRAGDTNRAFEIVGKALKHLGEDVYK